MFKRGVQTTSFLFLLFFSFNVFSNLKAINYTAPPNISGLNESLESIKYNEKPNGKLHNFLNYLFEGENFELNYVYSPSYNDAIQNSMIYNTKDFPEIIIGILFDENKIDYLKYYPYSIYTDYIVIVMKNSALSPEFKKNKNDIEKTLSLVKNNLIKIKGQNFKEISNLNIDSFSSVYDAMENVLRKNKVLVAPWVYIKNYLDNNPKSKDLKNISILKYPENRVDYFVAINKQSNLPNLRTKQNILIDDILKEKLLNIKSQNIDK